MNRSVRICHLSDLHLGYRKFYRVSRTGRNVRELDVLASAREAVQKIVALRPELTVVSGDLFHTVRPSNAILSATFRLIRSLAEVAPVVLIAGRGESPKRIESGSPLNLLAEIPGVYAVSGAPKVISLREQGIELLAVPFGSKSNVSSQPTFSRDSSWFKVGAFYGAPTEAERLFQEVGLPLSRLDYLALGGRHQHSLHGLNGAYSGATDYTLPHFWAEAGVGRGFLEVKLPGPHLSFHRLLTPRPVLDIAGVSVEGMSADEVMEQIRTVVGSIVGGIEGKLIRIELVDLSEESLRLLDYRELKKYRTAAQHLTFDLRVAKPKAGIFKPTKNVQPQSLEERFAEFYRRETSTEDYSEKVEGIVKHYISQAGVEQ